MLVCIPQPVQVEEGWKLRKDVCVCVLRCLLRHMSIDSFCDGKSVQGSPTATPALSKYSNWSKLCSKVCPAQGVFLCQASCP